MTLLYHEGGKKSRSPGLGHAAEILRQIAKYHARCSPDHMKAIADWGVRLMQTAKLDAPHRAGLIQYRDGLLIAMWAARPRRLRSMSLLRLGHEFNRVDDGHRVELQPEQVKTASMMSLVFPRA